jgi:translation initiation factor 3 subunit L
MPIIDGFEEQGSRYYEKNLNIPDEVESFLVQFQSSIIWPDDRLEYDEQINDIQDHYENTWNKLSDKHYKQSLWPKPDDVGSMLYQRDIDYTDEFRILYTELYYRHVYMRLGSGKANQHVGKPEEFRKMMYERFNSWENYVEFFNLIINCKEVPRWTLPAQWLWDIMDEFIYQFGQYRQYRSKMGNKTPEESEYLEQHGEALWAIHSVLNVLHSIVDKSAIVESLTIYTKSKDESKTSNSIHIDEFGHSLMYKYLGYFL